MNRPTFIILKEETTSASWKTDASTYVLALACLLPGHHYGAVSLTVLGWIVFLFAVLHAAGKRRTPPMNAQEAIAHIKKVEGLS